MHRASSYNMYIHQQDAQNSVIRLYFTLDAVHISDYISCYLLLCGCSYTTARRMVPAYTKCDVQLIYNLLLMMD